MADYTAKTIHESGMETECVVISLKYDLIDYIEKQYPEPTIRINRCWSGLRTKKNPRNISSAPEPMA